MEGLLLSVGPLVGKYLLKLRLMADQLGFIITATLIVFKKLNHKFKDARKFKLGRGKDLLMQKKRRTPKLRFYSSVFLLLFFRVLICFKRIRLLVVVFSSCIECLQ